MKYIIAGHVSEYAAWLKRTKGLPHEYTYISDVNKLKGIEDPHGYFIGSWYNRQDIHTILIELLNRSRTTNKELINVTNLYLLADIREGKITV